MKNNAPNKEPRPKGRGIGYRTAPKITPQAAGNVPPVIKPPAYSGDEDYIFVSYSHKDCETVYSDLWSLHDNGVRYWYDEGLPAGMDWDAVVVDKIKSVHCKAVLFYVSPNVFLSASLEKEIMLVYQQEDAIGKQRADNSFAIHLCGKSTMQMLFEAMTIDKNINTNRAALITARFGDKSTHINRNLYINNFDHIEEVLSNLIRLNLLMSENERVISAKKVVQKVLVVCKKSIFSNALSQGINHFFSQDYNISLVTQFIDKELTSQDAENKLCRIIEDNKNKYSGFIFRPPEKVSDRICKLLQDISELKKSVVLLDINLSDNQKKSFPVSHPVYVGSDFSKGGEQVGIRINEIVNILGKSNSKIILFEGPYIKDSVRERCESLKHQIKEEGNDIICQSVVLSSLNEVEATERFREKIQVWSKYPEAEITDKNLILFLGNDNIAKEIMKIYSSRDTDDSVYAFLNNARYVLFVGYDGLKDGGDEYILKNFGLNFITVDAVPYQQGLLAGEKMHNLLFSNLATRSEKVAPVIVELLKLSTRKYKSIVEVEYMLRDKKLFLFDLDGTIADTEPLHWKAYNELLLNQGIRLDNEHIAKYIGNSEVNIYDMLRADYNATIDTQQFLKQRIAIFLNLVRRENLIPYDYFKEIVDKYRNVPMALLTSQVPQVVTELLTYWELDKFFPQKFRFTAHDNKITKRQILTNIGDFISIGGVPIDKSEVLLFEDSDRVLEIAQCTKIKCIGIEHQFNEGRLVHADAIISGALIQGLFVGVTGQDVVHYYHDSLPAEDTKIRSSDFDTFIGGPAANAAIAYARLGGRAILASYIGNSFIGKYIKSELEQYGITVIDLSNEKLQMPNISSVLINESNGKRTIISGQREITKANLSAVLEVIDSVDFCLCDCNLGDTAVQILQLLSDKNKPIVLDAGSWKDNMDQCLAFATEVISSATFGKNNRDILQLADEYGLEFVAKTQGEKDILFKQGTTIGALTPPKPERVVDTLGAGDIFHGAYCYSRFQLRKSCIESLEFAASIASKSVEEKGSLKRISLTSSHRDRR